LRRWNDGEKVEREREGIGGTAAREKREGREAALSIVRTFVEKSASLLSPVTTRAAPPEWARDAVPAIYLRSGRRKEGAR
jgi:hypothetical protein